MRLFVGHPTGSTRLLRYQKYVRRMLRLFDVSAPRSADIISTIEAMNKLTLDTLAPAMTAPEPSIVRMSIRDLTETAILPIPTGRRVLLFNEYLMWARRFSPYDVVEVENVGLLRTVVYILGLVVETQQALTLRLGLRVAHELGWMAHREIADVPLENVGLPDDGGYKSKTLDYFVFPLYHSDLPLAAIYGGAGHLIADEVLRGLFHEVMYNQSRSRSRVTCTTFEQHCTVRLATIPRGHQGTSGCPVCIQAGRRAGLEQCVCKVVEPCSGQTFFVASCYTLCSSDRYVDPLYGDPRRRCNEPVKKLPESAAAFRCNLPPTQS
ncbi:hypothetical protein MRX96_005870 [Rhipicephalus microplus]